MYGLIEKQKIIIQYVDIYAIMTYHEVTVIKKVYVNCQVKAINSAVIIAIVSS